MHTLKIGNYIFLLLGLVVMVSHSAQAGTIDLDNIKPLSEVEFIEEGEFEAQTKLIEHTPKEDTALSYQVRLPKAWGENTAAPSQMMKSLGQETSLSKNVLGIVARYLSPPKEHMRSYFSVEALELDYEIGARHWFINYVLTNGLSLEQVGAENNREVEAIYIEVDKDVTYVVRVKAVINGARIVMARFAVPQDLYGAERVEQAQVLNSFRLTQRENKGVEALKIHGFLDQSFFDYPASWTLNAPIVRSIDRMRAMLYHGTKVGRLDGQMNIYLSNIASSTSRAEEIKYYRDKFVIENYELGKYLETVPMEYHKDMKLGMTQVYEMNPQVSNMINYELWVSVMEGEEYYYIISLLTPARSEEFYTWARNIAAFKMVIKGVRRSDEGVDYYQFIQ